jgi:hypothetical protein
MTVRYKPVPPKDSIWNADLRVTMTLDARDAIRLLGLASCGAATMAKSQCCDLTEDDRIEYRALAQKWTELERTVNKRWEDVR